LSHFLSITGDAISASYGKQITLRAVRKTVAGRGVDTIIIGLPAQVETPAP
jgi:RNase H-fold protein (predicted Holliday junction resolvase)